MKWQKLCAHHRQRGRALAGVLLGTAIALMPLSAWAQVCSLRSPVEPSGTNRLFRSDRFDLAFSLPANYRAMLRRNGHISLHDPASFDFLQCLARNGRYGRVPLHITVEVAPVSNQSPNDLEHLVRYKRPWVDYYNPAFMPITFAGQPALSYRYSHDIYGIEITNVSFLQSDGATLITIVGPTRDPVLQTVLTTFELLTAEEIAPVPEE